MNSKALFKELVSSITVEESTEEIASLTYLVLESELGLSKTDIMTEKDVEVDVVKRESILKIIEKINHQLPVQYILGKANFYNRDFIVNDSVLIPRQETEELIHAILGYAKTKSDNLSILDIGTGSGCIAVTLSLELLQADVTATDVSNEALTVAQENCTQLNAKVTFIQHDILNDELSSFRNMDVVVSNPPYITEAEKHSMSDVVLNHEPHLALFAQDEDALIFYKAIARKAYSTLKTGGLLAFEINEHLGMEVAAVLTDCLYHRVQIIKDINGKERIVSALR